MTDQRPLLPRRTIMALWPAALPLAMPLSGCASGRAEPLNLPDLRAWALGLVNQARRSEGLPPLARDDSLDRIAQTHAIDMDRRGYFDHVSPDGADIRERHLAAGGSRRDFVAENIGRCVTCAPPVDRTRVEAFHSHWMHSAGHRANILSPTLERFGYGIVVRNGGAGMYAVQTFAGSG